MKTNGQNDLIKYLKEQLRLSEQARQELENENKKIKQEKEALSHENELLRIELKNINIKYNEVLKQNENLSSKYKVIKSLPFVSKSEKSKIIINEPDHEVEKSKRLRKGEIHKKRFDQYDFEKNVSETIILSPDQKVCPKCGEKLIKFSEDVSYLVESKMPEIKITKVIKENFKCPNCNKKDNKIYYPISNDIFPGSILTPSLAAFIAFNKYELGIPFHHLSKYISEQIGIPLSKQCLGNYMEKSYELLLPIYNQMKHDLINNEAKVIHADETTLAINRRPKDDKNRQKSYVFLYSSSFYGEQINCYEFQISREAQHIKNFLEDFNGVVVCDDYNGYDNVAKSNQHIKIQRCWAHVRRRFANIVKTIDSKNLKESIAAQILQEIEEFFKEEKLIQIKSKSFEEILKKRRELIKPHLDKIDKMIMDTKAKKGSVLDEAFNYYKKVRDNLFLFLEYPQVEPTNNIAERAIKPFVIQRKTFMTSCSYDGAKITATLFSIIRTAKINMLDIYDYLIFALKNSGKIPVKDLVPYSKKIKEKFSLVKC